MLPILRRSWPRRLRSWCGRVFAPTGVWSLVRWVLATSLCVWVLVSSVYVQFSPVRRKLVETARAGQHGVSVVLVGAEAIREPQLVIVCRVRNEGATDLGISVRAGGRLLRQVSIAPRSTSRIDISWARPATVPAGYRLELVGSTETWALEYLELANLHGFTRGAISFLILPAPQPFGGPGWWWVAPLFGCALLLAATRPPRWSRGLHLAWLLSSAGFVVLFLAAVLSPLLSPFRVVLSPGTLGLGLLVLAAPRVAAVGRRVEWSRFDPVVSRLKTVPWFGVLTVLALVAYTLFLALHVGAYAGQADSSGYMNNARLLGEARVTTPMRVVAGIPPTDLPAYAYVPLGFRPHGDRDMTPTYPIGLPLAVLAMAWVTGWDVAPHVIMVWHALLGVILMYGLAREAALSRGWAALGTALLATSPLYLFMSLQLMSDVPAMVWTTAAVWLAWRSRRDARWAAAAGAALAFAVLVRPTNLLALAPIAVALGASFQRWAWLIAGGAPGAGLLLFYNVAAYGHPLETGYGNVGPSFSLANLSLSFTNYLNNLPVVLTPLVALAGGLPILWRRSPRLVTMLVLWISSFGVLYAFYYNTHETWWYLRFVLPAFPPLIVGALQVGRRLLDLWPRRWWVDRASVSATRCAAGVAMAALIIGHNVKSDRLLNVTASGYGERVYPEVAGWARTHLPPNAVVAAVQVSGALFYYTHFPLLRWDSFRSDSFAPVQAALKARGQPLYAVLFPVEIEKFRVLADHLPGRWTKMGYVRELTVWRFEGLQSEPPD